MKKFRPVLTFGLVFMFILAQASSVGAVYSVRDHELISIQRKSQTDQLQNTINNLKSLEAALKNLETMDLSASTKNQENLKNLVSSLQTAKTEANGIALDFKNFQASWDESFTDYRSLTGLSAMDYYELYEKNSVNVDNAIKSAMQSQGLISDLEKDADVLETLMKATENADGSLKVQQVGNQMTALLIQNMMRLQQTMGLSERSQSMYMLHKSQNIEASNAAARETSGLKNSGEQGVGLGRN